MDRPYIIERAESSSVGYDSIAVKTFDGAIRFMNASGKPAADSSFIGTVILGDEWGSVYYGTRYYLIVAPNYSIHSNMNLTDTVGFLKGLKVEKIKD
jgi:hypothetical protein